jgi:pimeloyl-ACP methyl ester carboxylesterase
MNDRPIDGDREEPAFEMPALLGWSQGALVAQMVAQKTHHLLSKLVLYGSIYDPLVRYVRDPLYTTSPAADSSPIQNTADAAMEDFTIEGTISHEIAIAFAEAALVSDPTRPTGSTYISSTLWIQPECTFLRLLLRVTKIPMHRFIYRQNCSPIWVEAQTAPGSILADADHAAHLLDGRERFCNICDLASYRMVSQATNHISFKNAKCQYFYYFRMTHTMRTIKISCTTAPIVTLQVENPRCRKLQSQ